MRSTRVAFVSHSRRLYGASRALLALLEGFRVAGVDVHVVLPGSGPMADALAARGVATTIVPFDCWVGEVGAAADEAAVRAAQTEAAAEMARRLGPWRPDVIWSNTSLTSVGALAAGVLGLPHVWHLREINTASSGYRFLLGSAAAMALMRTARARVAVSQPVRALYEALGSGPCAVIHDGVGWSAELAGRAAPASRAGPLRILLPGRVQANKGQLAAIAAVSSLVGRGHDVRMRILGEGDLAAVTAAIAARGLDGVVTLAGFVGDVHAEYRRADVVVSCARFEAMGLVTAEAMSHGLPVVGRADGGTLDLLQHEVTGLLCDGSADGIAEALARVYRDPDGARRIGERARRAARQRLTNERCAAASLAVLRRLVGAGARAPLSGWAWTADPDPSSG